MTFIDGQPLSRRAFARLSAAASVAALIGSGCREVGAGATHIRFWNGFTGPDGTTMLRIVKRFNALHDDVQVTMQRLEWGTYYNKLFVAGLGGRAPEVFVVHTDSLERFFQAEFLAPVDGLFASIPREDMDANVLAATQRDGKLFAMPLDVHPAGVYYNRKLFAEAGIARPPQTRAEFIDALHKLKRSDDAGSQWGFVYEWLRVNLYTLVRQWGGSVIADDRLTVTMDSPQTRDAMAFAASLILDLKLVPRIENMNAFIGFRQGRIGMVWAGIFMLQEAKKQTDLQFGAATVPMLGDQPATWAGSHNLCIRAALDERHASAAQKFVSFLSNNSLDWAEAGQVPVRKSLRETDRFRSMEVQSIFATQIPHVQYMPSTPFTFEYQTEFDQACELVLRGTRTPEQALKDAAANTRRAAARFATGVGGVA